MPLKLTDHGIVHRNQQSKADTPERSCTDAASGEKQADQIPDPHLHHDEYVAPDAPAGNGWMLDVTALLLWAPNGQILRLTRREAGFLAVFADCPGLVLTRTDLLDQIEMDHGAAARARLDTMISRMRSKARQKLAIPLPLLTAPSAGLTFAEPLSLMRG